MENAVTDFPLPDSPTSPSVSPAAIWKLTWSTTVRSPNRPTGAHSRRGRGSASHAASIQRPVASVFRLENSLRVGRSWNSPNTRRIASAISPTVARFSTAVMTGGTRLSPPRAATSTPSSASRHSGSLRLRERRERARSAVAPFPDRRGRSRAANAASSRVSIDADDDRCAGIDGLLRGVRRLLNLTLNVAGFDGGQCTAHRVDPRDQSARLVFDPVGHLLDRHRRHRPDRRCSPRRFRAG